MDQRPEPWFYFGPGELSFWDWPDRDTIAWMGGETIVFREQLLLIMESLAPTGLPPLEAILLTVAACRSNAPETLRRLPELLDFQGFPMPYVLGQLVTAVHQSLLKLNELPGAVRESPDGMQAVLSLVTENGPRLKKGDFPAICIEWLRDGYKLEAPLFLRPQSRSTGEWSEILRGLNDGLASVNEAAVRLRMRTGLEPVDLPSPIPLNLPEPQFSPEINIWKLLRDLDGESSFASLTPLVKQLLSVVTLPRPISSASDQLQGGVSDITNRGSFDRLLLSELAQDDDVLMTRVALDEALYLRREIPPAIPPRNRLVLVDSGIRMWGLPRLYAAGVALAFAANPQDSLATRIYRARETRVVPVELGSSGEFIEHLNALELPAHPGEALAAFAAEANEIAADFVIVTADDVYSDPDFRRSLSDQQFPQLYLIVVNRQGDLRLIHRTRKGDLVLRQVSLDLEKLVQPQPSTKVKLRDSEVNTELPAIFHARPFPLLLPHKIDWANSVDVIVPENHQTLLSVTADRRLMLWSSKDKWARQLCDRLPKGRLLWQSKDPRPQAAVRAVVGQMERGDLSLVYAKLDGTECEVYTLHLSAESVVGVDDFAGVLHVITQNQFHLFSLENGSRLCSGTYSDQYKWMRSRFYSSETGVFALTYHDGHAGFQLLIAATQFDLRLLQYIFDCSAISAPVVVTGSYALYVSGSLEKVEFQSRYLKIPNTVFKETEIGAHDGSVQRLHPKFDVTADGNVVTFDGQKNSGKLVNYWSVNLRERTAHQCSGSPREELMVRAAHFLHPGHLRTRFIMAGTHDSKLILMTAKASMVSIDYEASRKKLRLHPSPLNRTDVPNLIGFSPLTPSHADVGYELRVARWPDGTRITLDSRGLLHLRSSDPTIPEMTLVLGDSQISGWTDESLVWGDAACSDTGVSDVSSQHVFQEWLTPFCQKLQSL